MPNLLTTRPLRPSHNGLVIDSFNSFFAETLLSNKKIMFSNFVSSVDTKSREKDQILTGVVNNCAKESFMVQ